MTEQTKGAGLRIGAMAAMLTVFAADAALARNACAARQAVVDRLAERYGESRHAMGLGANNGVVEVFASSETGTWTITVTMPNGVTCLVASGQAFEALVEDVANDADNDA